MINTPKWNYLTVDTETANTLEDPLFYDCGWCVHDNDGKVFAARSYVCDEIFNLEDELMQSAYFAEKIPKYKEDLANGQRTLAPLYEIRKQFLDDCRDYKVHAIIAHNARFDYSSLSKTQRWLTKSKYRYFLPYNVPIYDTMKMAQDVVCKMPTYRKFCEDNGYICKNGQLRKTAEILYRFITKNTDFDEEHTALEDVLIEKEIFVYCTKQHKKMRRKLWED